MLPKQKMIWRKWFQVSDIFRHMCQRMTVYYPLFFGEHSVELRIGEYMLFENTVQNLFHRAHHRFPDTTHVRRFGWVEQPFDLQVVRELGDGIVIKVANELFLFHRSTTKIGPLV